MPPAVVQACPMHLGIYDPPTLQLLRSPMTPKFLIPPSPLPPVPNDQSNHQFTRHARAKVGQIDHLDNSWLAVDNICSHAGFHSPPLPASSLLPFTSSTTPAAIYHPLTCPTLPFSRPLPSPSPPTPRSCQPRPRRTTRPVAPHQSLPAQRPVHLPCACP